MIIGKNSIWKMLTLFALVLAACLDLIFCQTKAVAWINGTVIFTGLMWLVYNLYILWSKVNYNDKK